MGVKVVTDVGRGVGLKSLYVGCCVGSTVGALVGDEVGEGVGTRGRYVGVGVGSTVGATVGISVGLGVGAATVVAIASTCVAVVAAANRMVATMISLPVTGSVLMAVILVTMFRSLAEMPGASTTLFSSAVLTSVNSAVVEPCTNDAVTTSFVPSIWYVGDSVGSTVGEALGDAVG